jgi:hypothetical protein
MFLATSSTASGCSEGTQGFRLLSAASTLDVEKILTPTAAGQFRFPETYIW